MSVAKCNICGGGVRELFKVVIFKESRSLCKCLDSNCCHVQFVNVDWLARAYEKAIVSLDTGAVKRCYLFSAIISTFSVVYNAFNTRPLLRYVDYGGGAGLLTRLLRDRGLNAYSFDAFCENVYSSGFIADNSPSDFISLIEVVEHLQYPMIEMSDIIKKFEPKVIFFTTVFAPDLMEENWWYLTPDTGQHINFFTKKSVSKLATNLNYHAYFFGRYTLLSKNKLPKFRLAAIKLFSFSLFSLVFSLFLSIIYRNKSNSDFSLIAMRSSSE